MYCAWCRCTGGVFDGVKYLPMGVMGEVFEVEDIRR